jgi:hypothetical protein
MQEVLSSHLENCSTLQGVSESQATATQVGFSGGLSVGRNGLPKRDFRILLALEKHRQLAIRQIMDLIGFPNLDRAQKRCLALFQKGLLDRITYYPAGPGRPAFSYFLSSRGWKYLQLQGMDKTASRPSRIRTECFLEHLLAINDFWIKLERSCQNSPVKLTDFIPEFHPCHSRSAKATAIKVTSSKGDEHALIPDAVLCLQGPAGSRLSCLEIDRGTGKVQSRSHRSFEDQAQKYVWYHQSKGFVSYAEMFKCAFSGFQVLYVTTNESRIKSYQEALSKVGNFHRFFLFTTFETISSKNLLGKIWWPSRSEDEKRYSLLD